MKIRISVLSMAFLLGLSHSEAFAKGQRSDVLLMNESLLPGEQLVSSDGRTTLVNQTDGSLVLYHKEIPLWSTIPAPPSILFLQGDGNLVAYQGQHVTFTTATYTGNVLVLQDDCNLVLYDSASNPLWSTRTNPCTVASIFNGSYVSPNSQGGSPPWTAFGWNGLCPPSTPESICKSMIYFSVPNSTWNRKESVVVPWRHTDADTGGWCSYAGSALLIFDINQDGFDDWFCQDIWGNESVISGLRQFYGYPALRSRSNGAFCTRPMDYEFRFDDNFNNMKGLIYNVKGGALGCTITKSVWGLEAYIDAHTYLKPLF
ncbi:MAG TPA: hypothetical protein VE954_34780 [Oligoflexus sp.]|uniref:hypothetical protein n=1 Tax=Oligoflexus sp. TaxID=1971216 RepID=UPI002D5262B5|nr:hypothetical protein [Oligoflexus sp.]HYX38296.1 hypothetical protein [Oligoflexus sp.]